MFMVKLSGQSQRKVKDCKAKEIGNALLVDQCAVTWMMKSKEKLVADVAGHIPKEIPHFVYFFLHHGGSVDATVEDERYRPSPIAKGGLEIVLRAKFKIKDSKRFLLLVSKTLFKRTMSCLIYHLGHLQLQMKNETQVTMKRTFKLC